MNCEDVQSLLLQSDVTIAPDGVLVHFTGEAAPVMAERVAGHVNQCQSCEQFARKLRRLEKAVRNLPSAGSSSEALARFEARLEAMGIIKPVATWHIALPEDSNIGMPFIPNEAASPVSFGAMPAPLSDVESTNVATATGLSANSSAENNPVVSVDESPESDIVHLQQSRRKMRIVRKKPGILWRIVDSRLTAAALVALVVGLGIRAYRAREQAVLASTETITRLVTWNLKIAEPKSTDERKRLYTSGAEIAWQMTATAPLSADDRNNANVLIHNGELLSENEDPVDEASHFMDVADLLANKIDSSSSKTVDKLTESYALVVNQGIEKNLDLAEAEKIKPDLKHPTAKTTVHEVNERYARVQLRIDAFLKKAPADSHKALRTAVTKQKQQQQQRTAKNAPGK